MIRERPITMTATSLRPGDRVLDLDGDLFVIETIEDQGNQMALVDAALDVMWLDWDEPLWLDEVMPRVWRFDGGDPEPGPRRLFVETVAPGDVVIHDEQVIDVTGVAIVAEVVTLYEGDRAARTLDAGTIVEVSQ
jgi:hypothetical protein